MFLTRWAASSSSSGDNRSNKACPSVSLEQGSGRHHTISRRARPFEHCGLENRRSHFFNRVCQNRVVNGHSFLSDAADCDSCGAGHHRLCAYRTQCRGCGGRCAALRKCSGGQCSRNDPCATAADLAKYRDSLTYGLTAFWRRFAKKYEMTLPHLAFG